MSFRKTTSRPDLIVLLLIVLGISVLHSGQTLNFTLLDINNRPVTLSDSIGEQVVILSFWVGRCAPCLELLSALDTINKQYDDVTVLAINIDFPRMVDRAKSYFRSQRYSFNSLFDNNLQVARQFQVTASSHIILLGYEGEIFFEMKDYNKGDEAIILEKIEQYRNK